MEDIKHAQIIFRFYSELFEKEMEETLWAFELDKENRLYQIDSIPFYVSLIASNDIVFADYDAATKQLVYNKTISHSGHSTIQVILADESKEIEDLRKIFANFKCVSEKVNDTFFVMDIPDDVDYAPIKAKLDILEAEEVIEYAEPSLSDIHREQTS